MKITFKAKVVVDSPEHCEGDNCKGKYKWELTYAEVKRLIDEKKASFEIIMPWSADSEPTIIIKLL